MICMVEGLKRDGKPYGFERGERKMDVRGITGAGKVRRC